ncbi:MAG: hypothetical protein FP814_07205 [Desulfobacterium sp.]|nr:hypothetical protein [Desulfobacterium sp.]MBU3949899.1 hypothetical protein [Pseudomonadota bacterium]MBU4036320.1 hypothetical protein [Pseudomonadota bacterium]
MKTSKMKFGGKDQIVDDILNGINREVLYSLSFEQLAEIKKAIEDNLPNKKKHSIDVHFTLPLLFKRLYFVFSSGTDIRGNKKVAKEIMNQRVKTQPRDIAIVFVGLFCLSSFIGSIIYKIIQVIGARL